MNDEMIEMMKRMIRRDLEKNDLSISEIELEACILGRESMAIPSTTSARFADRITAVFP